MTVYGNFEAVSKVFETHHGSIWAARTAGTDETPDCCIKLMELNQTMLDERDTTAAQHLLVAAALQQAMGNKSEFWAPVYGLGSQGTNAFYASRLFPRSAQTLIDHRTALNASELKIILLAVVDGLMDLEAGFHRSHSNLKPSNVLISEQSKIREGGVMLCDPDASSDVTDSAAQPPDTKAIGELLYALVTHRPHATARWPLPQSDSWKELGSTGRQWRALCEGLLNTVSRRGLPTLDHVRDQIAAIRPTGRRIPRTAFALLALGIIAAAGYVHRQQLPGLYHQASAKVMAALNSKTAPVASHYTPTTAPARSIVAAATPPRAIAGNLPLVSDPTGVLPPALLAVNRISPAPPPPVVPAAPVLPVIAAVRPSPPVAIIPSPVRQDPEALKVVQTTQSPEFHSRAAKAEFIRNRDGFATAHASSPSSDTLGEWGKILSRIQGIDADYPPLDPASTTGWPAGLASTLNDRRDAMLVRAIDGAFTHERTDPSVFQATSQQVQSTASAMVSARDALARGDVPGSQRAIAQCNLGLKAFPASDADLAELFGPVKKEFAVLDEVSAIGDRTRLLEIADDDGAALAVRLAAWTRAGSVSTEPWPADLAGLAADRARADRLQTLLQEAGSVDIARQVQNAEANRQAGYFASLRDQPAIAAALRPSNDPRYAALLADAPIWFRYDAALYVLRTTLPAQVTVEQKQNYTDLAGKVEASGGQLVHDVLKSAEQAPPPLSHCGPGSVKGWQLRGGWTRDHCTFVSSTSGDTLEFLRVHVPEEPDGIDCYLCTTEAPVALMQHLLRDDAAGYDATRNLNIAATPVKDGMRVWAFDDKAKSINLDEDDYRKCFVVSPTDQLPLQLVTPQTAFYLSRRLGCRLPTSREWTAALNRAKNSSDANMKGFATLGWKLRDREFARLLTNPNREATYWPDENIFLGDLDPTNVPRRGGAGIWTTTALTAMGGTTASESPTTPLLWPLSTLQSSSQFGFRAVGDGENFAGVFHDLIGNVSEYVMDEPVVLAEKVNVTAQLESREIVRRIGEWFSPDHLAAVSVIGGSALSPPGLDPAKPYPLPKDTTQFADVGFRLAFTDPACLPNAQRAVIGQAAYLTAP